LGTDHARRQDRAVSSEREIIGAGETTSRETKTDET
jgi:hypothetical protein